MDASELQLYAVGEPLEIEIETLAEGNALSSVASAGSASTASCPATSASSISSASTYT